MSKIFVSYLIIFTLILITFLPQARILSHVVPFVFLPVLIILYKKVQIPKTARLFLWLLGLSIISAIYNSSNYINYLFGLNTWFVGIVSFIIAYNLGKYINIFTYIRFLIILSLIQIPIGLYQVFSYINFQMVNPFKVDQSLGDMFTGTMLLGGVNSHILGLKILFTLTLAYFTFQAAYLGRVIILLLLVIGWIFPSAVHSFLCFFSALLLYILLISRNIKVLLRLVILLFLGLLFILLTQEFAFEYARGLIVRATSLDNAPRKLIYVYNTLFELTPEKPHVAFLGLGLGQYSSYAALITSGELLRYDIFPRILPPETQKYIIPLWNRALFTAPWQEGVANQPWFTYMSLYGELGIVGLMIFIFFWFKIILILKEGAVNTNSVYARIAQALLLYTLTLLLLYFFDNWFEDARLMIPYFTTLGIYLKHIKNLRTNL